MYAAFMDFQQQSHVKDERWKMKNEGCVMKDGMNEDIPRMKAYVLIVEHAIRA
jgi:hypothetical protein